MKAFEYSISEDNNFYEVKFSGELRSGLELDSNSFLALIKDIKSHSESRVILIDLYEVTFWDSEGMRKILSLIEEINAKEPFRASILASRDTKNYERAKEKYDLNSDLIPWVESRDKFIELLDV